MQKRGSVARQRQHKYASQVAFSKLPSTHSQCFSKRVFNSLFQRPFPVLGNVVVLWVYTKASS